MWKQLIDRIGNKLFSGRYFLAVCAGIVFVYCSINKILDGAVVATIIVAVFKDYFSEKGNDDTRPSDKSSTQVPN